MKIKSLIPQNLKNIYHLSQAVLANFVYGFPSRKIKIIGITGTNGKTTTAQMITRILEEAGHPVKSLHSHGTSKVAMISTINFKLGEKKWVNKTKFTTLSAWATQKFIKQATDARCDYLILETSSHSLDQNRVWGVNYDTAVITNITREHLDYHKTMEKYRQTKLKLFKKAKNIVVNLDMEKPEEFLRYKNNSVYGFTCRPELVSGSRFRIRSGMTIIKAENIDINVNFTKYQIQNTNYQLQISGKFNIENALAAICVGKIYGIADEAMARALSKIKGIPGRLENVPNDKGLNIIIDYAVTPDSLEKLYKLIKNIKCHPELVSGSQNSKEMLKQVQYDSEPKIIAILGACGERDRGKRPIMGKIVSRYADYIILTNEDPYNEDPMQIINEVGSGIKNHEPEKTYFKILDRRKAIKKALQMAKPGDFVVVTGKGAEETMAIGEKRIPWNDKKVIREVLQEI